MGNLIHSDDLKRIFAGAGLAIVAGLAMGATMQPPLADNILAPQQEWAGGGPRNYATAATPQTVAYTGQAPDYVIGTDYIRPQPVAEQQVVLAYEERAEPTAYDVAEYARTAEDVTPGRWQDEPAPEPHYPSQHGNAYNPSDLPPAPEPPVELFDPA